jgi:hypothetical protein
VLYAIVNSKRVDRVEYIDHAANGSAWLPEQDYRQYGGIQQQSLARQEVCVVDLVDGVGREAFTTMCDIRFDGEHREIILIAVRLVSFAATGNFGTGHEQVQQQRRT